MSSNLNSNSDSSSISQTQFVSNIASIEHTVAPLGIAHMNVLPVVDLNCGVEGRDLGGVAADVQKAIASLKDIPKGTTVQIRGQSQAMHEAFTGMGQGLILAMVLVYLLMAINFQSWLDPLLIMMALPGALAGVLWMLVIWHTSLNVQSLMGAIMSVGVATTNGNLLITFANEYMEKENVDPMTAAIEAGTTRLRPVLMTALAMILGMLPMSLALGAGGGENAPLGRALIRASASPDAAILNSQPLPYGSRVDERRDSCGLGVGRDDLAGDRRVDVEGGLDRLHDAARLALLDLAPDLRRLDEDHVGDLLLSVIGDADGAVGAQPLVGFLVLERLGVEHVRLPSSDGATRKTGP